MVEIPSNRALKIESDLQIDPPVAARLAAAAVESARSRVRDAEERRAEIADRNALVRIVQQILNINRKVQVITASRFRVSPRFRVSERLRLSADRRSTVDERPGRPYRTGPCFTCHVPGSSERSNPWLRLAPKYAGYPEGVPHRA